MKIQRKHWAELPEGKLKEFCKLLEISKLQYLVRVKLDCDANRNNSKVYVKEGKKYTNVDVGSSGMYMIEQETGDIYGIKAYGVIHRGHKYGNLDTVEQYNWMYRDAIKNY